MYMGPWDTNAMMLSLINMRLTRALKHEGVIIRILPTCFNSLIKIYFMPTKCVPKIKFTLYLTLYAIVSDIITVQSSIY